VAELKVEKREGTGKYVAFNLRKEGKIPGVIYSAGSDANTLIAVPEKELMIAVSAGARIMELDIDGKKEHVLLKDLQHGTFEWEIMHVDFVRITDATRIHVDVDIVTKGEAPGEKAGGIVEHVLHTVRLECPARNLPDHIEVDLSNLQLGHVIYVSDLVAPEGVVFLTDNHSAVVSCHVPRGQVEEAPAAEPEAAAPAAATAAKK